MIFGIGVDIAAIKRFQLFLDKDNKALLRRLFTDRERAFCDARKSNAASYAARFAAKEAFLKALGTGLRDGLCWLDMEVVNNALGKPELVLSGKALEKAMEINLGAPFVSLSHDGDNAVAMVVLEKL